MGLRKYIAVRLIVTVPLMFAVSVFTFALIKLTPGNPINQLVALNPDISAAEIAELEERYGLGGSIVDQYVIWISDLLQGDFGTVIGVDQAVLPYIMERLPETIMLGLFGWAIALIIAIPTGIYAAYKKDTLADTASRVFALSGISLPNFWLGLMLILVFALYLDLWPVLAPQKPLLSPEMLWYLILPGVTIGTAASANLMRVMRSSMAEEMNKEYVTAARAKGLPERTVVLKHVLRNSLISVVTLAAFLTSSIFAGSVVVESVFAWPGLGRALVQGISGREVDLVLAITLLTGIIIVLANLLADIVYAILDPRIRYD
ncbi:MULTISPECIES: ABC transporter permease [Salinibaculum]|uniref:ABC transporter permease n=1 Tax=Salinibaculum TaxID=2732368 RepID=UPI0030CFE874